MADDWFKLNMDIFSNRKIKYLRRLPDGDSIALFWVALLSEARRCNSDGRVFLTESIPYTTEMLAEEFKFAESTVTAALDAFEQLDMTYKENGFITIAGWEDHQNVEGLAKIREQNRLAQQRSRARRKLLQAKKDDASYDSHMTVTECHATEEDKDREQEEKNKSIDNIDIQAIVEMYHSICISFPKIRSLSDARKNALKARLKTYTLDDFKTVFENAEASSFLKGADGGWKASFDWLIKEANMLKVLEGNYADKGKRFARTETKPNWMRPSMELGSSDIEAVKRLLNEDDTKDPAFAAQAEALQKRMQEKYGKKAF